MVEAGRGRPRETTHEHIRETAHRLFLERGYADTSLALIAAEVGISRTTLFSYFRAKHDLLWGDLEAERRRLADVLDREASLPVVDALAAAIVAASDTSLADRESVRLRWRLAAENPELRAHAAHRTEGLIDGLVDRLQGRVSAERELLDAVAHALLAVATRSAEAWACSDDEPDELGTFLAQRLAPFVEHLRAMLP